MNKLKEAFKRLKAQYDAKKDFFKAKINKLKDKNKALYKKTNSTFEELDSIKDEIERLLSQLTPDKSVIKKQIKKFKKKYKELHEVTKPIWRQWVEAIVFALVFVFILRTFVFGLYHVPTGSAEPNILVGDRIFGEKFSYFFTDIKRGDYVIIDKPDFIYDRSNSLVYLWQKYVGLPVPMLGISSGPDNWTKRVIAIPGDTIEGRVENGKTAVYLNGKKLDEKAYVNPYPLIKLKKTTGLIDLDYFGPFKVPSYLRKIIRKRLYTYDPQKSFAEQPFYKTNEKEVIRRSDGSLFLEYPYTPTYRYYSSNGGLEGCVDVFGPITLASNEYFLMGDNRKNSTDSRFWGTGYRNQIHGKASFVIWSLDSEEALWLFELIKHPIEFWTKSVRWDRFFKLIK